jgi:hypothetical protein
MKPTFHRNKINLTVAALAAGMGAYLSAHAQDAANVIITGQITANTCAVNVSEAGVQSAGNSTRAMLLGNMAAPANTTVGGTFGNPVTAMFTLGSVANSATDCTFSSGINWVSHPTQNDVCVAV